MTTPLIPAIKKDAALLQEMDSLLLQEDGFAAWWLGQSGFLLQWKGKRVLIDPYLSDTLTVKYAGTPKPHVRMSERVIDPALLRGIAIVTSSHNHTDHLDAATLQPVLVNNPSIHFIIPEANRDFVAGRVGCSREFPTGLDDGRSVTIDGFTFHGIPASHNTIEKDENGNCIFMGYVITFGNYCIYHSGDTLLYEGMAERLRPFSIDVAMLPINGDDPARGVAGNLNSREAVQLAKEAGIKTVIPCHYDMFTFNTADVREFEKEATAAHQSFCVLKGGERFEMK